VEVFVANDPGQKS